MFKLSWHLSFYILLESTEHKRPNDGMEATNEIVAPLCAAVNDAVHGIREPIGKFFAGSENMRH